MNDQQQSCADALTDRIDDAIYRHIPPKVALENAKALYAMGVELLTAAPADGACNRCGSTTAQACNDAGCFYLESGDGEPSAAPADERAASWHCEDPVQKCSAQCDSCAKQARSATEIADERAECIAWANANGFPKYHESMCAAWEERARRAAASPAAEAVEAWINYPVITNGGEFAGYGEPELSFKRLAYGYDTSRAVRLIAAAPQPEQAASPGAEEMRDAAMRTVQAMGLVYTPGSDHWRPNPNHAPAAAAVAYVCSASNDFAPIVRNKDSAQRLSDAHGDGKIVPLYAAPQPTQADAPAEAREPQWRADIIADLQGLFDTEGITENDSGDALIRLSDAIEAVENAKSSAPADAGEAREPLNEVLFGNDEALEMAADALDRLGQDSAAAGVRALRMLAHKARCAPADAGEAAPFGWAQPKGGNYFTRNELSAKRIGGLVPVYTAPAASRMARLTDEQRESIEHAATWLGRSEDLQNKAHAKRLRALLNGADR